MKDIIAFENVCKIYNKKFYALNNVNLKIGDGMFGLLGPNGAGKSTLMKSLITLIIPDKGSIMVNGYDTRTHSLEVRDIVGYLPQDFSIYPNLTAFEFLDYMGQINNIGSKKTRNRKIEEVLNKVNLWEARNKKVGGFSGGMKRRLGIANAILKDPKILIVDEPTAGLDPEERVRFRMLLVELSKQKCVILSTHIVEDISSSCERIGLLNKGSIEYLGSPMDFILEAKGKVREFKVLSDEEILKLKDKYEVISVKRTSSGKFLRVVGEDFQEEGYGIDMEPNLEDAYMYFMKYGKGEKNYA
ncbi:ABC transporter ATP-binding protein [Clostridium sp. P21]|uniref:ABC transporter ATP-binding protein n=1 Tax=Clostridium muellerianum TaxID=2716538 RepID=A0A7Y0EEU4_9CLOT|nr:ABC transporter ATP-binding protein [Clostridium muellerianum]NMM61797.1 ABC transporter ATP-binding protein [Clostridium muellerianum]